jgi:serine protease Do
MTNALQEISTAVSEVAAQVGPSVVGVGPGGSGVVVGAGAVLTNAHNLRGEQVVVTFADGRREQGSAGGIDVDGDLAVVTVDTGDVPAVSWSDAPSQVGDVVIALSRPGGRPLRVTAGLVSATDVGFRGPGGRRVTGAVEHTAPLARGSSGGPVTDALGRVVGIDTHRLGDGFYAALAADASLAARVDALGRGESPHRPRLGIAVTPPRVARRLRRSVGLPERDGLLVHDVEHGGPAERSGLRQGDLIVAVAGSSVASADDLAEVLAGTDESAPVELTVVRGVDEMVVAVDLRARSAAAEGSV